MKIITIAVSAFVALAIPGFASAKEVRGDAQRYGATESDACRKAQEGAKGRFLSNVVVTGVDPCTCGVASFTKPGATNRYWCRTVAHGRVEPRTRRPGGNSSPR